MAISPIEKILSAQQVFVGLSPAFIKFLAGCATERQIEANHVVFRPREHADKFYLIRSGQVAIEIPAIMGPALKVQSLGAGQILGWSWLISPYKWSFQARTEEPSTVLEFDGAKVLARCEEDPKFGYEILKRFASLMSERLDAARQSMMEQWNPPGFA